MVRAWEERTGHNHPVSATEACHKSAGAHHRRRYRQAGEPHLSLRAGELDLERAEMVTEVNLHEDAGYCSNENGGRVAELG